MTCDEAVRSIDAMLDREIDDDERLQLEAHLAGCEACRREVEERRALSDRLGRELNEAFPARPPAGPRIVFRPRRQPWVRWAAVVVLGIGIGYVGTSSGLFTPASAEAREVASLSATKEAYEDKNREVSARLKTDAMLLDRIVSKAPEGTVRDVGALTLVHALTAFAGEEKVDVPQEPERRVQYVLRQLCEEDLSKRARGVYVLRQMPAADLPLMESKIVNLEGAERTFMELWLKAAQPPSEPVISMVVERDGKSLRVTQHQDARVRVETTGLQPKVYEAPNLLEFRCQHPAVANQLKMKGVDGKFWVGGVLQSAPAVENRPIAYVPAVVATESNGQPARYMDALAVQAVMNDYARAGHSLDEAEKKGQEVFQRVHRVAETPKESVQADPARVRSYLRSVRDQDRARLTVTRAQLNDDVVRLERRLRSLEQRLESVRKALAALEYADANR